jgi:chromosome partitioning protein
LVSTDIEVDQKFGLAFTYHLMVIALANQKGGVGKTTATLNIAEAFVRMGRKVLIIDNDAQGNLTQYAAGEFPDEYLSIDELYLSKSAVNVENIFQVKPNLALIGASPELSGVEYYLVSRTGRESLLKEKIAPLKNKFDFILIDNPPSLNLLTINGLVASDKVIVPVQPEYFSLEGIRQIKGSVDDLRKWHTDVSLAGIFLNMFDDRRKLNSDVQKLLRETFGDLVFETVIHDSVKIPESSGHQKSVLAYAPASRSSKEFQDLAKEISERF